MPHGFSLHLLCSRLQASWRLFFFLLLLAQISYAETLNPTLGSDGCQIRSVLNGKNDSEILLSFKNGLVGQGEPALRSWDSINFSSWKGVTWGQQQWETQSVVKLELAGLGLQGEIFPLWQELHQLTILNLSDNVLNGSIDMFPCGKELTELDVSHNMITGSLSSRLPSFSKLRAVNLSHNLFSGDIPPAIFGMQLNMLDLSNNNFTGNISMIIPSFSALETLDLSCNNISGNLPLEIGKLHALQILNASHNRLTGKIPTGIGQLQRLAILDLNSNQLGDVLSPSLFDLGSIKVLDLAKNNFTGAIPEAIGRLSNLTVVDLSSNYLSGELPSALGNCSHLVELKISGNSLTGMIPRSFANLSRLQVLNLGFNKLSGSFDLNFSGFPVLEEIYLANNYLGGSLPMELGYLVSLKSLVLHKNLFDGSIPGSLGNCSQLEELWFDHNNLTGSIPEEISLLSNLKSLVLAENQLSGAIPAVISNCTRLTVLWLEENAFSGPVPLELGSLKNLLMLSLASNNLEGTIPPSLGHIESLIGLDLGSNSLIGQVPDMLAGLSSIQFLFLPHNQLEGFIPYWIGNYSYLRAVDLSYNKFTGPLPYDWSNLTAVKVKSKFPDSGPTAMVYTAEGLSYMALALPTTLDFSHNWLTGSIPDSFGDLQNLQVLDLSVNRLSGEIPKSLGNSSGLLRLDLSNNTLIGPIPVEISKLNFLSSLNLSYNFLAGEIPDSGQLSTFGKMSFLGNDKLCGLPLDACSTAPSSIMSTSQNQPKNVIRKLLPLYIIIAGSIGFCGFWGFFFALLRRGQKFQCSPSDCKNQCPHYVSSFSGVYPISLNPKELAFATDNYSQANIVGDGGSGMVYRAVLADGSWVAVKKLVTDGTQGEREFLAEMQTLGKVKHKNLVSLLGYSADGNDRILVYKYLKNGSLDTWLHCREEGMKSLDWPTRLKILHGAAQGICFLHYGCSPPIIHRDIKVSNILLDEYFEAHVADFGLARLMHGDTHVSTDVAGTVGYIPPEYNHTCIATTRGDVYSFGVVVLEILSGKRPTDYYFKKSGLGNVVSWLQSLSSLERASLAIDNSLVGTGPADEMLELMKVAYYCCQEIPGKRPSMKQVVHMIEKVAVQPSIVQSPTADYKYCLKNVEDKV
ncbi:hypothetical protein O6H91_03G057800 [Diphasiastrum complanatum]|uniref:Uncharacterized protein n=1 Tax=Diphasiastrum complanatum TaxID=34168 RepID=A0ACC2E6Q3_DIPCM|nr:hypothetical protein O6H91_03G057800 [Diphasiastrum complanatum]